MIYKNNCVTYCWAVAEPGKESNDMTDRKNTCKEEK
jgi:hypothetical protein